MIFGEFALGHMPRTRVPLTRHDGPPSIFGFRTLSGVVVDVMRKDFGLTEEVFNNGRSLNLSDPKTLKDVDFSKPGTLKLLEEALDKKIAETQAVKDAADYSFLPRAMRSDDGSRQYNDAELQLKTLQVAKDELAMLKKDAAKYDEKSGVKGATKNDAVGDGRIHFKLNLNTVFGESASGWTVESGQKPGSRRAAPKPDAGP
jgi:hypothetical protein